MKRVLIIVLSLYVFYGQGQTTLPRSNNITDSDVVMADASDSLWCISSQISLSYPVIGKDTITYDFMANVKELILNSRPQPGQGSYYIISFKLQVNEESAQSVSGSKYDFYKLTQLKRGGKLKITECQVNCHGVVTLPDKLIIITKGVN